MKIEGTEYYNYVVVFHGEADEKYSPVITSDELDISEYNRTAHLLMPELIDVLDSLEFILHLPRLSLDLYNQDELLLDSSYDTPHIIIPLPDSFLVGNHNLKLDVTGFFVSDNCDNEAIKVASSLVTPLGVYRQKELRGWFLN